MGNRDRGQQRRTQPPGHLRGGHRNRRGWRPRALQTPPVQLRVTPPPPAAEVLRRAS